MENKKSTSYRKCVTIGSLFDGSGGFPLAGALHGAVPLWASEIEPYPIAVTRSRFPNMKHLGSVTDINGAEIDPVDIITFGSPCQDMSVAGRRAGMQHSSKGDETTTRSGLFYEAVRIIKEMRENTNGEYPKFAIWENVPGAFTSNKGEDFLCVLEELYAICAGKKELSIPRPKNGKWTNSGEIVGDRGSIAWRVLDAQYWGVPQRRKRIYLVADFNSDRAGKILFERDSLLGNPAESREARQGASENVEGSVGRGCVAFAWANSASAGLTESDRISPTIKAARCGEPAVITESRSVKCLNPHDSQTIRQYDIDGVYPALSSNSGGGQNRQGVCYPVPEDHVVCLTPWDCQSKRQYSIDGAYRTLDAGQSSGGQAHGVVYSIDALSSNSMRSSNPNSGFHETDHAKCLDTAGCNPSCNQGGNVVVASFLGGQGSKAMGIGYSEQVAPTIRANTLPPDVVIALQGNGIDRKPENGCAGKGYRENEMYTLDVIDRHAVAYHTDLMACSIDCRNIKVNCKLSGTLQAKGNGGYSLNYQNPVCYIASSFAGYEEANPTLRASGGDAGGGSEGIICMLCCNQHTDIDSTKVPMLASGKTSTGTLLACASSKLWLGNQEAFTGDYTVIHNAIPPRKYIVRRLVPTECARLQGFPDCWGVPDMKTDLTQDELDFWNEVRRVYAQVNGKKYKYMNEEQALKWYNNLHTDSSEYKMWGNGIALPCAEYVVGGVVEAIME